MPEDYDHVDHKPAGTVRFGVDEYQISDDVSMDLRSQDVSMSVRVEATDQEGMNARLLCPPWATKGAQCKGDSGTMPKISDLRRSPGQATLRGILDGAIFIDLKPFACAAFA